jgi:hypothetical protein
MEKFEAQPEKPEENKEGFLKSIEKTAKKAFAIGSIAAMGMSGSAAEKIAEHDAAELQKVKEKLGMVFTKENKAGHTIPDTIKDQKNTHEIFNYMKSHSSENWEDHVRSAFVTEKKLIVYGVIETPDKKRGGIVPNSQFEKDGKMMHEEVRRRWSENGEYADYIDRFICDEKGTATSMLSAAFKGSDEYIRLYPYAMEFAKKLDKEIYADLFKNNPIGNVLHENEGGEVIAQNKKD